MFKKRDFLFGLLFFFIVLFLLFFLFLRGRKESFAQIKGKKEFNYILISVDTLRADRIGCYGFKQVETPYMDLFASLGVKFEICIAQTPLTLPSHVSLLTGTQPLLHGVRDNGGFLVPQELVSLAELFKERGYQTAAFVAVYVLDSKWGLNQGFDYYFDKFDLSRYKNISLGDVQRRADEVIDEALGWLRVHEEERFFTWIHLYDPHTPYEPPSPFSKKYEGRPYIGEIAYADYQLGRLWQFLEGNNLLENTFLIFTSDHGESLGEHEEGTHGFFIYQEAVHVPLIFVFPFQRLHGLVRKQVVSLVDIMPTILEMEGIAWPSQVQGRSLVPLFFEDKKTEENIAYSETYYPRFHFGWSELKGIQDGRFKLIIAPELELYDLVNDPDEEINLASTKRDELKRLKTLAGRFIEESSRNAFELDYRNVDEETRQKLAALGYVGSFTDTSRLQGKELANPRDKIGVFNRIAEARELSLGDEFERAVSMIEEIIKEDSDIIDAYFTLGNIYFNKNKFKEALDYYLKVFDMKPDHAFNIINIANSYLGLGKLEEAEKIISDTMELVPPDSLLYYCLGSINKLQKKYEQAKKYLQKCLDLNPYSASGYSEMGAIYVIQERLDEAEKYLRKAIEINPKMMNVHYNFAQFFEKKGNLLQAAEEYRKELDNIPHHFRASYNLSVVYRNLGDTENEEKYLEKTIEINPDFPLSYFFLARIYLHRGRNYKKAIDLVNKGIGLKPDREHLSLGYFLLADLYNRLGDNSLSLRYAQKGKEILRSVSREE